MKGLMRGLRKYSKPKRFRLARTSLPAESCRRSLLLMPLRARYRACSASSSRSKSLALPATRYILARKFLLTRIKGIACRKSYFPGIMQTWTFGKTKNEAIPQKQILKKGVGLPFISPFLGIFSVGNPC